MQNRYLYRAKRVDTGEWVEGFYFCMTHPDGRHTHHFIIPLGADLSLGTPIEKIQVEVDPSTICRCTELKDKNGTLIWEHDIVSYCDCTKEDYVISWEQNKACFEYQQYSCSMMNFDELSSCEVEVIGNVFDNPELLEV